jgi:ActR/RegA family two-component response regulator
MVKQILIVDDDRELSRMLRATIELFDRSFKIVEVPSAEEAMLESRRNAFDLVIADIRLPGMDGLEMIRRIRKIHPATQAMIITGGGSPATESEAKNLNIVAYFSKPLNTNDFIGAVQRALGIESKPAPNAQAVMTYSPSLADRLSALRRDLGCLAVYLADLDAQIVARAGDVSAFDIEAMVRTIEVTFSASLKVCGMLGGLVPQNLHFFDGDEYDAYVLNVGQFYMLVMLFPGDIGARQMGQVARYGRLAADDMLNVLADSGALESARLREAQPDMGAPPTMEIVSPELPEPIVLTPASDLQFEPAPAAEPEPAQVLDIKFETLDSAAGDLAGADVDSFWEGALAETEGAENSRGNEISFEQALKLGLVPKEDQK